MEERDETFQAVFEPLFEDLAGEEDYPRKRPLLAHYTSVDTFQQILDGDQIWFSNPVYMNDWQEVHWGILEGTRRASADEKIREACGTPERVNQFVRDIECCRAHFGNEHALDTYIFCFSEHELDDDDGLLSMWRGYGANGAGIALVIDTGQFIADKYIPLVLARVQYGSDDEHREWLDKQFIQFADILKGADLPTDKLCFAAMWLFERLKMRSIFSKHRGFLEEQEWRAVYMPWRDKEGSFKDCFNYAITPNGVQPKLKLPVAHIAHATESDFSLEKVISRIILGPTVSSPPFAKAAIERMLDHLKRPALKDRIYASGIPFRRV